jgi:16S rRNA (cytidine1402-2'-O)-methyltransferase
MSKLYVTATPIGNLGDISQRAVETLRSADLILCEDTRVTSVLCRHFGITAQLVSYHKFNEAKRTDEIVTECIGKDMNIVLVSDAGMPCISDPGWRIVNALREAGCEVVSVPGACAVSSALSVSGFDITEYLFLGFFPRQGKEKLYKKIEATESPFVFYESPHRIIETLRGLAERFPDSKCNVCNDLTKMYERNYHGHINDVIDELLRNDKHMKGEYTVVVLPVITKETDIVADIIAKYSKNDIKTALNKLKNMG